MTSETLTELRRLLDDAMTYADYDLAWQLAEQGLGIARDGEVLGEIMYFRAQMAILRDDYATAMEHLDGAIRYNPKDGAAYNDRALCMVELGEVKGAMDYFDRGIAVEPDYATIYHNKGWLLNRVGRSREAIPYFEKALALEPDRAVTYENLANAYERLGRTGEAMAAYRKALRFLRASSPGIKSQIEQRIRRLEQ